MKQILHIPNRLPGMNEMIDAAKVRKGGFSLYAEMKKRYGLEIALLVKMQKLIPFRTAIDIDFHWYEVAKKRDKDNIAAGKKIILDALVDTEIIGNDDWRYINSFRDFFHIADKESVRIIMKEAEDLLI